MDETMTTMETQPSTPKFVIMSSLMVDPSLLFFNHRGPFPLEAEWLWKSYAVSNSV